MSPAELCSLLAGNRTLPTVSLHRCTSLCFQSLLQMPPPNRSSCADRKCTSNQTSQAQSAPRMRSWHWGRMQPVTAECQHITEVFLRPPFAFSVAGVFLQAMLREFHGAIIQCMSCLKGWRGEKDGFERKQHEGQRCSYASSCSSIFIGKGKMLSPPLGAGMDSLLLEIEPAVVRAGKRGCGGRRERGGKRITELLIPQKFCF